MATKAIRHLRSNTFALANVEKKQLKGTMALEGGKTGVAAVILAETDIAVMVHLMAAERLLSITPGHL